MLPTNNAEVSHNDSGDKSSSKDFSFNVSKVKRSVNF